VSRVPLLLIESLDGAAAAPDDGRLRAAVLREVGFAPQVLTLAPAVPAAPGHDPGVHAAPPAEPLIARRDARAAVRDALTSRPFELVVVASAIPGADEIARWLPAQQPAQWWPAGLVAAAPPRRLLWGATRGLRVIGREGDGPGAAIDPSHAALDWAIMDGSALARRQHPLWDGDYLLVPAALAGESGEELLATFAAVARDHASLDLIVLADPQAAFERFARGLGVGMRVHFVGAATREAEWSWLKPASAMLITGPGPIAAGLVVRALACGCPVVGAGAGGVGPALNAWLASRGAALAVAGSTYAALTRILDRAGEVDQAIERGRRASAAHQVAPLAERLAAALPSRAAARASIPGRQAA
jgi:hypothetical protein